MTERTWDGSNEEERLRSVRERLEQLGNVQYALATAHMQEAEKGRDSAHVGAALEHYRAALTELGNSYYQSGVADDTALKVLAAESIEKQGRLESAVSVYQRVLNSRMDAYAQKFQIQ